ncbi:MAG: fibronectin type III domain-containing protein, partial [Melioribacteraceae bacterium]|nr:fibronectin type III domain-containing protein [Melioribacteraceae bacterium]
MKSIMRLVGLYSILALSGILAQNVQISDLSSDYENSGTINDLTSSLFVISDRVTEANSPFLISNGTLQFTFIEHTNDSENTEIFVFKSVDQGSTWSAFKKISSTAGSVSSPYAVLTDDLFVLTFIETVDGSSDIILYYNNLEFNSSSNLSGFSAIESGTDDCINPAVIIDKGILSIIYFNLTDSKVEIFDYNNSGFVRSFSNDFYLPDGTFRVDGTKPDNVSLFAFNSKLEAGGKDQLIVMEKTSYGKWVLRYSTTSSRDKSNPTIASSGLNWIVFYQQNNSTEYIYKIHGSAIQVDQSFGSNTFLAEVGATDIYGGFITAVYKDNQGAVYKANTLFSSLPDWRDPVQLFEDEIEPLDDIRLSLWTEGIDAGVSFVGGEVATNGKITSREVYFSPLGNFTTTFALKPSNLTSVQEGENVALAWTFSVTPDSFRIYRKSQNFRNWEEIANIGGNLRTYSDESVELGHSYCYRIRAYAASKISAFSDESCVTLTKPSRVEIDVVNTIDYSVNVLIKNSKLGDLWLNVGNGSLFEGDTYTLPTFEFRGVYNSLADPFNAIAESEMKFGNLSDQDLFLNISIVFDLATGKARRLFNENLFLEMWVDVYTMPNFELVDGTFDFKTGETFTYSLVKDKDLLKNYLRDLDLDENDLGFAYITENGYVAAGINLITSDPEKVIFEAGHFSKFGGGAGKLATLPVELTTFLANVTKNGIELNWRTETEIDNYGFQIERSFGDKLKWENIGFVNGNGTSNLKHNYSFVDDTPLYGKSYYRLKQIDFDGKFEYSNTIEVDFNNLPNKIKLNQNYPNPFNPETMI